MSDTKKFNRISKRDWENKAGEQFVYTSAIYFEGDKKGENETQYGKEIIYGGEFETDKGEKTEIELRINKTSKALGKVNLLGNEYTIWTNSNDNGSWNSFKVGEVYYNVKEGVDKNGNKFYVVSYRLPKEDNEPDIGEETDFNI